MHELIIRGGTIVDGRGLPPYSADLAVDDGRITEIGKVAGPARREVDADGLLVTPGFVDIHTHLDGQALWDPLLTPSSQHGVTTVVGGNCGVGFAPVAPDGMETLVELFAGVEDIPASAFLEGMPWGEWETFGDFLDLLDRTPRSIDLGLQVGHGPVRVYAMGERGSANEAADADDIAAMARCVRESMMAGALGFSTSRTPFHKSLSGAALPGTFATKEELFGLLGVLGELGTGVIELSPDGSAGEDLAIYEREVGWMIKASVETGRPVTWGVVQYENAPDHWRKLFQMCVDALPAGARLHPQTLGRAQAVLVGHQAIHPFLYRPSYLELSALPFAEKIARLGDPEVKRRILTEESLPPPPTDGFAPLMRFQPERIFPIGDPPNYEPRADQSIAAIATRTGRSAHEELYDAMLARDGRELLLYAIMNFHNASLDDVREMLVHPQAVVGLSDAGAHCGFLCDASIPTYLLTHWTRDRTRGPKIPVETIVHKQTGATADLFGLHDRGELVTGKRADINIIDLEHLRLHAPRVTHDLPGGGRRLTDRAEGYIATLVRGQFVQEGGEDTGARPGRVVRAGVSAHAG